MKNFLLIDDHEIVRSGVKNVLQQLFRPCTIFEAGDEKSALAILKQRSYDIIILDVQMPGTDSLGLMEHIKITYPDTKVLVFSMSAESIYAKRFLAAGAMGFVSKSTGLAELHKAIEVVLNNRKYISPELANQLATEIGGNQTINPFHKLSVKEFEVCTRLITGKSVTDISQILNISTSTVGTHKARIFEKLNVKNLVELFEIAKEYNVLG
ncbi:MAG: response regulator transcription factor [Bacteroidia bacterium]|nr:response regulator transcription factor [Bacteroidia bacterium]